MNPIFFTTNPVPIITSKSSNIKKKKKNQNKNNKTKLTTVVRQNRHVNTWQTLQTASAPNLSPDDLRFPSILLLIVAGISFKLLEHQACRARGRRDSTVSKQGQTTLDCVNSSASFLSQQAGIIL